MNHSLTNDNYYQDKKYLSSSALSNYVKFDNYGNPIYSFQDFANPPSLEENDNVQIGKILDELLTEWVVFDDKYVAVNKRTEKFEKISFSTPVEFDEWDVKFFLEDNGIDLDYLKVTVLKTKKNFEMKIPVEVGADVDAIVKEYEQFFPEVVRPKQESRIEITKTMYNSIMKAKDAILSAPYTKSLTFGEYISQPHVSNQAILVDEDLMFKGKFDFLDTQADYIIDLKCTGSVAMCKKEILWNGHLNLNHKWVRQMSIYRHLLLTSLPKDTDVNVNLAIVGHDGSCWFLNLGAKSLDLAFQNVLRDIKHLRNVQEVGNYIESYTHYVKEDDAEEEKIDTQVYTF